MASSEAISGVVRGNQWRHQRPSVASSEAISGVIRGNQCSSATSVRSAGTPPLACAAPIESRSSLGNPSPVGRGGGGVVSTCMHAN